MSHSALPISLYVRGRRVVVVGDGRGAKERVERLQAAGAAVEHIAPGDYRPEIVRSAFAVVANGTDEGHNRQVAEDAHRAGALTYAHDQPGVSDFAMPALYQRGPLRIAISSSGEAPAISRRIREEITRVFEAAGEALDALLDEMRAARTALPGDRRGELYPRIAARLHLRGRLEIDPGESPRD